MNKKILGVLVCTLFIVPVFSVVGSANKITSNVLAPLIDDDNNPPNPPQISGPTFGKVRETYDYEILLTDPDEDDLMFYLEVDFGDGTIHEDCGCDIAWYNGTIIKVTHRWKKSGNYGVSARVQDGAGEWSNWSDPLAVTMPKTKESTDILLRLSDRIIVHLPVLEKLIFMLTMKMKN